MSRGDHNYWVYIVSNNTRSTLYIGVTNDLLVRIWQHRSGDRPTSFAQRYRCGHLVYREHYGDIRDAIAREKQLKGWRREKKNALISKKTRAGTISRRIGINSTSTDIFRGPSTSLRFAQDDNIN